MRETKVNIEVRPDQKWYFEGNEIIQEKILLYFKQNLKKENGTYYIYNQFGELTEKGAITVHGFPWKVEQIYWSAPAGEIENAAPQTDDRLPPIYLETDCGRLFQSSLAAFKVVLPDTIWVELHGIEARLGSAAMVQAGRFIEESEDGHWQVVFRDEQDNVVYSGLLEEARPSFQQARPEG